MKINNNIQALNAYRNLNQNQMNTSKNLEKLSSGLRINRAADDAAGLAISEKMRSQIRGLKMAERNAMDGISLMQTSEGAMQESHTMLQRMRELAVQAANDTNTDNDRDQIQKEIDQLKLEIDSISEKTEFNTRKLLDGSSAMVSSFPSNGNDETNIMGEPNILDPNYATGNYELNISSSELDVVINQPGPGLNNSDYVTIDGFGTDEAEDMKFGEYTIITRSVNEDNTEATIEILDPDGLSLGQPKSIDIGSNAPEEGDQPENIFGLGIDTSRINGADTAKISIEAKAELTLSRYDDDFVNFNEAENDDIADPVRTTQEIRSKNGNFRYERIDFSFNANIADGDQTFNITNNALAFQIGPNTNQDVMIDIPRMNQVALGVEDVSVLDNEAANQAIFSIDKAIDTLNDARSKLGAVQNRMEHTINNLQVTHENLTSAESRIRDADMAEEMTEFTKNNILNQSATAMLAQANQLPQGVLQLLQ
ncbi:flagellin N-terminal helical domain-containing protein [Salisediminibacterium beveridgei]|uniref:Flagellin n=1 Tax=Salisediminibacterium beveridgei TaxID=632773 RepID=A0A1D7QUK1_9BACI|nr:flagellin [Salisediminibacterium beveridgei]AOM82702.1 Flagellin protein FlaA [Salisediminibacterium beveridgei]